MKGTIFLFLFSFSPFLDQLGLNGANNHASMINRVHRTTNAKETDDADRYDEQTATTHSSVSTDPDCAP